MSSRYPLRSRTAPSRERDSMEQHPRSDQTSGPNSTGRPENGDNSSLRHLLLTSLLTQWDQHHDEMYDSDDNAPRSDSYYDDDDSYPYMESSSFDPYPELSNSEDDEEYDNFPTDVHPAYTPSPRPFFGMNRRSSEEPRHPRNSRSGSRLAAGAERPSMSTTPNQPTDVIIISSSDEEEPENTEADSSHNPPRGASHHLGNGAVSFGVARSPSSVGPSSSIDPSHSSSSQSQRLPAPLGRSSGITSSRIPMIDLTSDDLETGQASSQASSSQPTEEGDNDVMVTGERRANSWTSVAASQPAQPIVPQPARPTVPPTTRQTAPRTARSTARPIVYRFGVQDDDYRPPGGHYFGNLQSTRRAPPTTSFDSSVNSWLRLQHRPVSLSDRPSLNRSSSATGYRRSPRFHNTDVQSASRPHLTTPSPYTFHDSTQGMGMRFGAGDSGRPLPYFSLSDLDDDFPRPYPPFSLHRDAFEEGNMPYGEIPPVLTAALSHVQSSMDSMYRRNEEMGRWQERAVEAELDREREALPPPLPGFTDNCEGAGSMAWACTYCDRDFMGKDPIPESVLPRSVKRRRLRSKSTEQASSAKVSEEKAGDDGSTVKEMPLGKASVEEEEGQKGKPTLFDAHGIWAPKCGHMMCGECVNLVQHHRTKGGWVCKGCPSKLSGKGFRQLFTT